MKTSVRLWGPIAAVIGVCVMISGVTAPAQTTAVWTGAAGTNSYNTPGNWDIGVVPVNTDTDDFAVIIGAGLTIDYDVPDGAGGSNAVTQLSLAANSTINLQGRNLVVHDSADIAGKIKATSGSLVAAHLAGTLSGNRAVLEVNTSANPADSANITLNASGTYLVTNTALNNTAILSAGGANAAIYLPYISAIDSYVDHWGTNTRTISATQGGLIDLSGVTLLRGGSGTSGGLDRVRVVADTGGQIDLSGLTTVQGNTFFEANAGGILKFGRLAMTSATDIRADGFGSKITVESLMLDSSAALSVTDGAEIDIAGTFQNAMTNAAAFGLDTGIVRIRGVESAWFEVAGQNLGNTINAGNFGMMQLVIGSPTDTATVYLTDIYDNDGRGQDAREALYLFGSGGLDGLAIFGGSKLVIGDVPVYAFLEGSMVQLQSLFEPGQTILPFNIGSSDGFLIIPEPATLVFFALGGLVLTKRRK